MPVINATPSFTMSIQPNVTSVYFAVRGASAAITTARYVETNSEVKDIFTKDTITVDDAAGNPHTYSIFYHQWAGYPVIATYNIELTNVLV
jgi:hypothetical protein